MTNPDLTIIQSPEAERMRRMVTEGFYDRSRIGLWMFEIIGREYDDMAEWARALRNECFPQTCTWSIAIWEFVYGIEPDDSLSLEYRRSRILTRKLQQPPINPARIEAALSALSGCPVSIIDPIAPYTFRVVVDESNAVADHGIWQRFLREIKPSHLSFRTETRIKREYTVTDYSGGVISELWRTFFYEEADILTDVADLNVGASADWIRESVEEAASPILTDIEDYNAGSTDVVIREYFMDFNPMSATAASYDSVATDEIVKEVYTE